MKNKKRFFSAVVAFSLVFLFAGTLTAMAADIVPQAGPKSLGDITNIINNIVKWFQGIVLALGVIMIAWAGFTWMTAGGDETKLKTARERLIYGLVGIGVALFAGGAQVFINNIIGGAK